MKDPAQEAFEICYEDVAGGVPLSAELERAMLFWVSKNNKRYSLLLFGWPGETIRGAVVDGLTMLVISPARNPVPIHLFMFATALPLLAIFKAGPTDDA